ncbi:RDD family protein [Propionivibrio dicarboxylicus]|uniref:RDD family protein n=2 Tax=Propionivibrio dicarboxylicus TaxID=83767 RepID=A0A1G7ZSR8_9RHOO|nr:RDD family protein [Propionivibrio dicarboxylicus]
MCYEALLVLALLAATLLLPHLLVGAFLHRVAAPFTLWIQVFATLLVYFVWFWSAGRRTLAMKTWKIRIVASDGSDLRPAQALLRYLLCWPSFLLGGIGILWGFIDRDRQFLHDRLAGTRLIGER